MAINRTFGLDPALIGGYAYQVGTARGTKQNVRDSLDAAQQSAQIVQRGNIAAAELAQRGQLAEMDFAAQREGRMAQLAANQMDNERMLMQEQLAGQNRLELEQLQQGAIDERATMNSDLRLRNDLIKSGALAFPDVTEGPMQQFGAAVDNQQVFTAVAGRERQKLYEKFAQGDPQAVNSALASGRARLGGEQQKALAQLQSAYMKSQQDTTLRPQMKAQVQAQLLAQMQAIKSQAEWLPDEAQPKTLQEQIQGRVTTITGPKGEMIHGIVNPKGDFVPWHEMLPKPEKSDAPKPPDPEKVRAANQKQIDDAIKAMQTINPTTGAISLPSEDQIKAFIDLRKKALAMMGGDAAPQSNAPPTVTPASQLPPVMTGNATPNAYESWTGQPGSVAPPQPQAQAQAPAAGQTAFGGFKPFMQIPTTDGGSMPVGTVMIRGRGYRAAPLGDRGFTIMDFGRDGSVKPLALATTPNAGESEAFPLMADSEEQVERISRMFPKGTYVLVGNDMYQTK